MSDPEITQFVKDLRASQETLDEDLSILLYRIKSTYSELVDRAKALSDKLETMDDHARAKTLATIADRPRWKHYADVYWMLEQFEHFKNDLQGRFSERDAAKTLVNEFILTREEAVKNYRSNRAMHEIVDRLYRQALDEYYNAEILLPSTVATLELLLAAAKREIAKGQTV